MATLTHLDEEGRPTMVDVSSKHETVRWARARGEVHLHPEVLAVVAEGGGPKGDALVTARLAGIQAAKRTADLIPLCHPLRLTDVKVSLTPDADAGVVRIEALVGAVDRTGVEMEALTAVSVAALTLYDMVKAVDRFASIEHLRLVEKSGGKSGVVRRPGEDL